MPKPNRIFYVSPVASEDLNRRFQQRHYVGPADAKVFGVCRALRSTGASAVVVSTAIDRRLDGPWSEALRTQSVPFIRVAAVGRAGIRRIIAAFTLLLFAIRTVRPGDRVLLYNFFPEYLFLALYLKARGRPAMLDIEDGPTASQKGARGVMTRVSYNWIRPLTVKRCVVASLSLASKLGLSEVLPIYGVARQVSREPTIRFTQPRLGVLFGGAIMPETGLELFADAVRLLAERSPECAIDFHISGHFDREIFLSLKAEVEAASSLRVLVHGALTADEYGSLTRSLDVGLCLKLPSHEMGQTTFPSKVVEIASLGLLLCTTPVSDVPELFDESTAALLQGETPAELADLLSDIEKHREKWAQRAGNGQAKAQQLFAPHAVAARLESFLHG